MARKAKNPGIGRGHHERPETENICRECGAVFTARSYLAQRCEPCREARAKVARNRPRPERYKEPGVGKGGYDQSRRVGPRKVVCKRCFGSFMAGRSDAKWCPDCRVVVEREHRAAAELQTKYEPCPECNGARRKLKSTERCRRCADALKRTTQRGEGNNNWKGGLVRQSGYIYVRVTDPDDPKRRYKAEHVMVWEAAHGPIPKGWHVHHLNGVRNDNRPENLVGMSASDHHSDKGLVPYQERIRLLEERLRAHGVPID